MLTTIQKSYLKLSTRFSFLTAGLLSIWIVTLFMLPVKSIHYDISPLQAYTFINSLWIFLLHHLAFVLACAFMIPLVQLFYVLAREKNKGIVSFMTTLCIIGLAFGACGQLILFFTHASFLANPIIIDQVGSTILLTTQLISKIFGSVYLLLVGIWLLVNSILAFNNKVFPQILILLGLFTGTSSLLIVVSQLFINSKLSPLLFTIYTLLLLVWIVWESLFLHNLYITDLKNNDELSKEMA